MYGTRNPGPGTRNPGPGTRDPEGPEPGTRNPEGTGPGPGTQKRTTDSQKHALSWDSWPGATSHDVGRHSWPPVHCSVSVQVFTHWWFGPAGMDPAGQVAAVELALVPRVVTTADSAGAGAALPQPRPQSAHRDTRANRFIIRLLMTPA